MAKMTKPVCPECGSDGITRDACARWSVEAQDWVLSSVYDDMTCDECGHDSPDGFKWVEIDAGADNGAEAQGAQDDGGRHRARGHRGHQMPGGLSGWEEAMKGYHCEWRIDVLADDPIEAAIQAAKIFLAAVHDRTPHTMNVIDEHGEDLEITLVGTEFHEETGIAE